MHRSASTTRASDEYYLSGAQQAAGARSAMGIDHLPTYDPVSDISKKEAARLKFAESMVHLIPLVILLCAMILWFFSNPAEIEMATKDDSILSRVKNMTIDGYSNWNGTTMTIGMEDLDPIDGLGTEETGRDVDSKD